MQKYLTIIHPCYNPKKNWEKKLVDNYTAFIASLQVEMSVNLILVNDGSTKEVFQNQIDFIKSRIPNFTYIHNSINSGKGFALRSAVQNIHEGLIIYTDVDNPYRIENSLEICRLLMEEKCDVVIGTRTKDYYKKLPMSRVLLSILFRLANHLFFPGLYVKDTQAGLKGFNQIGKNVFLKTKINGFLFDVEFIRLCVKENIRMQKITIQLNNNEIFLPFKYRVIKKEILNFITLLKDA